MGECGCVACGNTYKLPGPKGTTYLIKLLPACNYCSVGPTIRIETVTSKQKWMLYDLRDAERLPASYDMDGIPVCDILAGPSKDELCKAARDNAYEECDEVMADILAEAMYDSLPRRPEIVTQTSADNEQEE